MVSNKDKYVATITLILTLSLSSGQHNIRLVNGPSSTSGRVEIYYHGVWHTVCDDDFDEKALRVVCRMIGIELDGGKGVYYDKAQVYGPGNGNGEHIFDNFHCSGTESSIFDCRGINTNDNCGNSEDIGVDCLAKSVRLVGGSPGLSGRVEIMRNGYWHTVCDDTFNRHALEVVCRMFGIELDARQGVYYGTAKVYGPGSGNKIIDNFRCSGRESSILSCPGATSNHDCSHNEDVSVDCSGVRLIDGPTNTSGRVEVFYNSEWQTVCDAVFDRNALKVVCRMVGIDLDDRHGKFYGSARMIGPGSEKKMIENLRCSGTESSIYECFGRATEGDCSHRQDVSVDCSARLLGSECQLDGSEASDPCTDNHAKCIDSSCTCVAGFFDNNGNNTGGVCIPKVGLNTQCSQPDACGTANAECSSGTCICSAGFYDDNGDTVDGFCVEKVGLNTQCSQPYACGTDNAECSSGTCICSAGFYDDNGETVDGLCVERVGLNSQCPQSDACGTTNAECSSGTCVCSAGFYDDNGDTVHGSCVEKIDLESVCPEPSASVPASATCLDVNAECTSSLSTFVCKCVDGYFDSNGMTEGGTCIKKVGLNTQCSQPDACVTANAECSSGTCICSTGFFDINGDTVDGFCVEKKDVGMLCPEPSSSVPASATCKDINAECILSSLDFICQCSDGYFDSNGDFLGGSCIRRVGLNSQCPLSDACGTTNAECSSGTCVCSAGFYDDNGDTVNGSCVEKKHLGSVCPEPIASVPASATCFDVNAECTSSLSTFVCKCVDGYFDSDGMTEGGTCLKKIGLNTQCSQPEACGTANAECSSGTCICSAGFYDDNGHTVDGFCVEKKDVGMLCPEPSTSVPASTTCKDVNAECKLSLLDFICQCSDGYFDSIDDILGRSCKKRVGLNTPCPQSDACGTTNAECRSGTCVCSAGFYDDNGDTVNGSCVEKIDLGSVCPEPSASVPGTAPCIDVNAECTSSLSTFVCKCVDGYYDSNRDINSGLCIRQVGLNTQCSQPDACGTNGAVCSSGICMCSADFYDDNGDTVNGSCVEKVGLNSRCSQPDACGTVNAECSSGICVCSAGFFDDNGGVGNGSCVEMSNLQVSAVTFLSSMPGSLNVSWSLPEDYKQYIDEILIQFEPIDNRSSSKSVSLAGSSTSTSISDLIPGQAYTITVNSINNQTEPGSIRVMSLAADQATKPELPGPINEIESDLDAENNTIYIVWNASIGYVSGYIVKVFDSETNMLVMDKLVQTENVLVVSPSLEDGHMYRIAIIAKSQMFLGKTIQSDKYTEVIKTMIKFPDPPTDLKCVGSGLSTITLSWIAPSKPYGKILQYHIHVYQKNDGSLFITVNTKTNSTTYTVSSLKPGTYYGLEIYTENENYNSSVGHSSNLTCRTSSKKADPPSELNASAVQSRTFTVTWAEPNDTYSEENYGYVARLEDSSNRCLKEHIYMCNDCTGTVQVSSLENLCGGTVQTKIDKKKFDLAGTQSFQASDLLPDKDYFVTVMAVNSEGLGEQAVINITTSEEAPKTPTDVHVIDITTNTFTVTWNIDGPRPGKTNFTIIVTADPGAPSFSKIVTGFEQRRKMIENLEEFWNYTVSVNASTSAGSRNSEPTPKYTTMAAAPGNVTDLIIAPRGPDHRRLVVSWKSPALLDKNGIIIGYKLQHNASEVMVLKSLNDTEKPGDHVYKEEVTVIPENTYYFEIWAVNHEGQNGSVIQEIMEVAAGVPINTVERADNQVISTSGVVTTQNSVRLTINRNFLLQENNGRIRATGLIGCELSKCNVVKKDMTLLDFNTMDNWADARRKDFTPFRITNNTWIAKKNRSVQKRHLGDDLIVYTVGSDKCDENEVHGYCNGPLEQGLQYKFVAVTCTNGGCLLSKQYGPFATEKDERNKMMTFIIAIGVVVAAFVIGVVVALIFYRRRRNKFAIFKLDSEKPENSIALYRQIPKHRPIILSDFSAELKKLHNDSNINFTSEFMDLNTVSSNHPQEAAERVGNRMKNRYPNILPFDHCRVKLFTNREDDTEDYINASYLPGYNSLREYIGCQGPIPGTVDDFWQMVWEQNVSVIVMLTLCREDQKEMCEKYWPNEMNESKRFGDIIVELNSYSSIKIFDYRIFKLVSGDKTRIVKHFQFLSWLDFEANLKHEIMLDFISQVRSLIQPPDTSGPIVVHCSAGVGRTGTFIILDHLLQLISSNDYVESIDIFNMVLILRENRPHIVQTEQQYMFIHDCVKLILERRKNSQ